MSLPKPVGLRIDTLTLSLCAVCRALERGRLSAQRTAECLIFSFSRNNSSISSLSSVARHLFPSVIAVFCSTYLSMSESWMSVILARSSTVIRVAPLSVSLERLQEIERLI
jgi:hypothetical protein